MEIEYNELVLALELKTKRNTELEEKVRKLRHFASSIVETTDDMLLKRAAREVLQMTSSTL